MSEMMKADGSLVGTQKYNHTVMSQIQQKVLIVFTHFCHKILKIGACCHIKAYGPKNRATWSWFLWQTTITNQCSL